MLIGEEPQEIEEGQVGEVRADGRRAGVVEELRHLVVREAQADEEGVVTGRLRPAVQQDVRDSLKGRRELDRRRGESETHLIASSSCALARAAASYLTCQLRSTSSRSLSLRCSAPSSSSMRAVCCCASAWRAALAATSLALPSSTWTCRVRILGSSTMPEFREAKGTRVSWIHGWW